MSRRELMELSKGELVDLIEESNEFMNCMYDYFLDTYGEEETAKMLKGISLRSTRNFLLALGEDEEDVDDFVQKMELSIGIPCGSASKRRRA